MVWNKGLSGEEYRKHFSKPLSGGRVKGYKHTEETKRKCSLSRRKLFESGYTLPPISDSTRKQFSQKMRDLRKDEEFTKRMFASFNRESEPHRKFREILLWSTSFRTVSEHVFSVGNRFGAIDEADLSRKVAFFVDGEYWHRYPSGRSWDKRCDSALRRQGWTVVRIWAHEIENCPKALIDRLREIDHSC